MRVLKSAASGLSLNINTSGFSYCDGVSCKSFTTSTKRCWLIVTVEINTGGSVNDKFSKDRVK